MIQKDILLNEAPHTVVRYHGIPVHAIEFWKRISWGAEGAVYQNLLVEEHIPHIVDPSLLAIETEGQLQATAVFSHVKVHSGPQLYSCHYIRYFATDSAVRGQGLTKRYGHQIMSLVKEQFPGQAVYFALVERGNKASFKSVQRAGYEHTATIKTIGFSRFFPNRSSRIHLCQSSEERRLVLQKLHVFYGEHALVQFNPVFLHNQYYVLKDHYGKIIAGCQYHRCHWQVNKMPGFTGKLLVKTLPYLPLLRRIFNPKSFKFLAFEAIFVETGGEAALAELFEGILQLEKLNTAMYWLDSRDPQFQAWTQCFSLGLIHPFIKSNDVYMMQSFQNFSEAEAQAFKNRPFYASAFDYA